MTFLVPQRLLARSFLLIVVLIVASLAASVAIFRDAQQAPQARQMAQLVASVVNLTRAAIMSAAPQWRGALLAELADSEGMRVHVSEIGDLLEPLPDDPPELRMMVSLVRQKLGDETRFASRRNGMDALWVSFYIGLDEYWVAMPHERIEHHVSEVLLVWGSVVFLLALLGAYFIARQVAHPLRRLAHAGPAQGWKS